MGDSLNVTELQKVKCWAKVIILEGNEYHVIECERGWDKFVASKLDSSWLLLYTTENDKKNQ